MTKLIVYETEGTEITQFKRSAEGKAEKVIKHQDWQHDPKKLRKVAERLAE